MPHPFIFLSDFLFSVLHTYNFLMCRVVCLLNVHMSVPMICCDYLVANMVLNAHLLQVFGDRKYLDAAVDCGEVVWDRGLLRKGYGLCHGVAGNAHTFLQLFRLTTRPEYFNRAVKVCKCVWQMCEGVEIEGMQQQEPSCSTQFAEWCLSVLKGNVASQIILTRCSKVRCMTVMSCYTAARPLI